LNKKRKYERLGACRVAAELLQATCNRRHAPGLIPAIRLKTRVKWLWSANPQAPATSDNDNPGARKKSFARSTRCRNRLAR